MRNAIVTGATGFVGRWLVRKLLSEGVCVTAVIRPNSDRIDTLPEDARLSIVACEMKNYEDLARLIEPKDECVFFHLAWEGVYGPKRVDLETQLKCIDASRAAVVAASRLGCKRFVGLGSIMEKESVAVAEADNTRPAMSYIYGEAKHMAHLVTKAVAAELKIDHVWPILTNPYGEYDDSSRFINATLNRILRDEALEFSAGTQIYDFIHIEDAVKGIIAVAKYGKPFHSYMLGSGKAAPLRSFIETIGKVLCPNKSLLFGNIPYTGLQLDKGIFSIETLSADTGFVPEIQFDEGICRTMDWLKSKER